MMWNVSSARVYSYTILRMSYGRIWEKRQWACSDVHCLLWLLELELNGGSGKVRVRFLLAGSGGGAYGWRILGRSWTSEDLD